VQTIVSVVFKIFDRFNKKPVSASSVLFTVGGENRKPVYKTGGYFVFTDLACGNTSFELHSPVYESRHIEVDVPQRDSEYKMVYLMLNPSSSYPFGSAVTTISGLVNIAKEPLSNQPFYLLTGKEMTIKIAQDDACEGNDSLKLFASSGHGGMSVPGTFLIQDKNQKNQEFCTITDSENEYHLSDKLLHSHPRGTPLVETVEYSTNMDGKFTAVLPASYSVQSKIELIFPHKGRNKSVTLDIRPQKVNDFGVIEIEV
jgi:hypothetical protein